MKFKFRERPGLFDIQKIIMFPLWNSAARSLAYHIDNKGQLGTEVCITKELESMQNFNDTINKKRVIRRKNFGLLKTLKWPKAEKKSTEWRLIEVPERDLEWATMSTRHW